MPGKVNIVVPTSQWLTIKGVRRPGVQTGFASVASAAAAGRAAGRPGCHAAAQPLHRLLPSRSGPWPCLHHHTAPAWNRYDTCAVMHIACLSLCTNRSLPSYRQSLSVNVCASKCAEDVALSAGWHIRCKADYQLTGDAVRLASRQLQAVMLCL